MSMHEDGLKTARILSVAAATWIAFSCGTNYAYSAWGPQFAERLHLTATQSNVIGNAANIGMYATGIPTGLIVDNHNPRWGTLIGSICLATGYFPLWWAFDKGPGNSSFILLCLASFLTGVGSCAAFTASIKVSASNWPQHRGTATALPLAGFGLSAFLYTGIGKLAFSNDAEDLLLVLSIGTFVTVSTGMIFLRLLPPSLGYTMVMGMDEDTRSAPRRRDSNSPGASGHFAASTTVGNRNEVASEASPLLKGPRPLPDDVKSIGTAGDDSVETGSHVTEITGRALLRSKAFWKLFGLLGILCGVGLMTINNIGNDAKTLWHHFDGKASSKFIEGRQLMHVAILSVCSFLGRLASGIGSDILVKKLHASRFWSLVASSSIFVAAQICALIIENPNLLFLVSSLTGLGYGALFGVYPALVADAFGTRGMGINWGAMTMAPVVFGAVFNLLYGVILDAHSHHPEGSERVCLDGRICYAGAYFFTAIASVFGVAYSLWCVRLDHRERRGPGKGRDMHEP